MITGRPLTLTLVLTGCLGAPLAAQQSQHTVYRVPGLAAGDRDGWSTAAAGDVDKDGVPDILVGGFPTTTRVSGSARVISGRNGRQIHLFTGSPGDNVGFSVAGVGDIDLDGHDDVIVGARCAGTKPGYATIYSGRTGAPIRVLQAAPPQTGNWFGHAVAGVGDVDKDGIPDVLVGAIRANAPAGVAAGMAYLYSGRTGGLMRSFAGTAPDDNLGSAVAGVGDVDGDTYPDFAIGAMNCDDPVLGADAGQVQVFSGRTFALLWTQRGIAMNARLGCSAAAAGDVNGDKIPDVVVGSYSTARGRAYVFDGRTGARIWEFIGKMQPSWFGLRVDGAGDIDGDGQADVVIGARRDSTMGTNAGAVYVMSGRTGLELQRYFGAPGEQLGQSVAGIGDVNADGKPDVSVGTWAAPNAGTNSGRMEVFSIPKLALATDIHIFDSTNPVAQTQRFSIDAGTRHAGMNYLIVGSVTGARPGFTHLGIHIPLMLDVYTDITFANRTNTPGPVFGNTTGVLGIQGTAQAQLTAPAGSLRGAGGLTLFHAYIAYNNAGTWLMASNPTPLYIK